MDSDDDHLDIPAPAVANPGPQSHEINVLDEVIDSDSADNTDTDSFHDFSLEDQASIVRSRYIAKHNRRTDSFMKEVLSRYFQRKTVNGDGNCVVTIVTAARLKM